jgi:[ribosomal protein S18]-alanine N-acetyltransferase
MREEWLEQVVWIEEMSGLNRWGYEAYRRELVRNPSSILLAARSTAEGGRILGFLAGWTVEDEMHVNNIATHPDFRRMGIGRALMEAGIQEARARGGAQVLLEVRASNEAAQAMYRALGFSYVGRRRDYYRAPTEDAFVMKLKMGDG